MKRSHNKRRSGLKPAAEQLMHWARGFAESGSRAEDCYWDRQLSAQVDQLLSRSDEETLNAALDHLLATQTRAYEELADCIEARAEYLTDISPSHDVLLIAIPILAWSRYRIPAGTIPAAALANLRVQLQTHILAEGAYLAVANHLFSPDQLPRGYCATANFTTALSSAALENHDLCIDGDSLVKTNQYLSDSRYILAATAALKGQALFAWQENHGSRDQSLARWRDQGGASLTPLLTGCSVEVVLPDAYFAACRQTDRQSRPYSLSASVAYLGATLDLLPSQLRACIAPFQDQRLEEYRIGFTRCGEEQVIHGIVWPMLGPEDEDNDVSVQIDTVLRDCGISDIVNLDYRYPLEYCEDCGAPLFPSAEGEIMHAEMPEESVNATEPPHLH